MPDDSKHIEIQDKGVFDRFFREDPPQISEFTFTNLFIWSHRYHPHWVEREGCLLIILNPEDSAPFGLQPVGAGDKEKALDLLCRELGKRSDRVQICRVFEEFVNMHVEPGSYSSVLDRDNSDYVYSAQDLIRLTGRRYHRRKNHLNHFLKNYRFEYRKLEPEMVGSFLDMQERWCQIKNCVEHPALLSEDYAVYQALTHFKELGFTGGAIEIGSKIEAFALGEVLNPNTAVVHIEKANPEIAGLYTAINQLFCSNAWSDMEYVNMEQDLGIEGLRRAKESYYPHHMVNKYTIHKK